MGKLRHYWPLIAFVVPSALIAYGVVLPRHGITGLNEISVGFAASLAGAALSYAMGIASISRTSCPLPWRIRVNRYINRQAGNPRGLFGHLLAHIWKRDHRAINQKTLDLLDIDPGKRVLEIGSGPGETLRLAVERGAHVIGIDVSHTMVAIARRRNQRFLRNKRVEVRAVRDGELALETAAFDGAYTVHCVYFWATPEAMLAQIGESLKPGARLVLAYLPDTDQVPSRLRDPSYRFYAPERIEALLAAAGFVNAATVRFPEISETTVWTIAVKP